MQRKIASGAGFFIVSFRSYSHQGISRSVEVKFYGVAFRRDIHPYKRVNSKIVSFE